MRVCLKTDSEEAMTELLEGAGIVESTIVRMHVVGEIPERTGWHVNLLFIEGPSELILAALSLNIVDPAQPYCVWA
jgi:hypothetical protein